MEHDYGLRLLAEQRIAQRRQEAEADRLAAACRKRNRERAAAARAPTEPSLGRRRWRARLAWLFHF